MQTRAVGNKQQATPGVIDTIADGLTLALSNPLVMTLPLLLDAYYWLGWKITPEPLVTPIRNWIVDQGSNDTESTVDALNSLSSSDMTATVAQFIPALLPGVKRGDIYEVWSRPTLDLSQGWIVGLVFVALIVLSTGVWAAFYVPLADIAIGRSRPVGRVIRAIGRTWLRFLGMLVLFLGLVVLTLGPLVVIWGVSTAIGVGLGALVVPLMVFGGVAMAVLLIFTPEAIVIADVGPLRGMYYSVNVVRRNLWPTIGFTLASMIISFGLGEIWQRLAATPPGLLTAVIANAFFAVGLVMAGMIFFSHRLRLLPRSSFPGLPGPGRDPRT
jgi:MFS family permease